MIYFQDNPMNESSYISIGHHYVKETKNEKAFLDHTTDWKSL